MKIFVNEKVKYTPWGGGMHFLGNLVEYLRKRGHKVIFKLKKKIDLIFIMTNFRELDPRIIKYKRKYPNTKVLQRVNISDISKNVNHQDKLVFKINKIADETVFISEWLANYYIQKGFDRHYTVIYNGCNTNYFYPSKNKEIGKIIKLVTHHWSNNWMKGFDIYNEFDRELGKRNDIEFTYIGNYNERYNPKNVKIIPPLYGENLGNELRRHDIYLTASRWEACGMHHIEGASCGLPVLYHSEGGGINEACMHYGEEYNDIPTLLENIEKIKNSYQKYRNNIPYEFLNSERCSQDYYDLILKMFQ